MSTSSAPAGLIVHWANRYDWLVKLVTLGRERRFQSLLKPAQLAHGESVLDIGCGTGTLAMIAKERVGSGTVTGIDASPEMIARARNKSAKAGVDVAFEVALAQALPFPDARVDVVLSTVMLHHLPRAGREEAVREVRRVLKPGGRFLAVDFARSSGRGLLAHLHMHGRADPRDLISLVTLAGLSVADSGPIGAWNLQFVVGRRV